MLLGSGICHTLCFLPQALAPNIWMIILFRSIQGIASSGANR
jgi:MFS family permease